MTKTSAAREVFESYRTSIQFLWPFFLTHLLVRLLVLAVITPLAGLLLSVAITSSGQDALTDQDIAYFLFTPLGMVAALAIACLLVVAAVFDISIMTAILRTGQHEVSRKIGHALQLIRNRAAALFGFAARLVIYIILIALPFVAIAAGIALIALKDYDINYYLTYWPPTFVIAAVIIGLITLALALVLVWRLSGWSIALNLLLFQKLSPGEALRQSANSLSGHKARLVVVIIGWVLARGLLVLVPAVAAGFLINIVPGIFGANLRYVAAATIAIIVLWAFVNAIVEALSNGALSDLLNRLYSRLTGDVPETARADEHEISRLAATPLPAAAVVTAAIIAIAGGVIAGGVLLERIGADRTVEIIAHRGAAGSRPENTMAAVEKAVEDQADWVEIDVQETADDEVVIAHDSDFMKLAGVDLKVWDATMTDLARIDIGSWFDSSYSQERTPTLRQALKAVKGRCKVLIELKYYGHDIDLESRVADIVEETGMVSDVAVMSLKQEGIRKMQAIRPNWRYGILAAKAIGNLAELKVDFLAVNTGQVSMRLIRKAHARGKQVYVWTVDDPLTMSRMISMGVDGLITNEPALARQIMDSRNKLTTYQRLALWLIDRFRIGSFDLVADESNA